MRTYPSAVPTAARESSYANLATMTSFFSLMVALIPSFCLRGTFSRILRNLKITQPLQFSPSSYL